MFVHHPGWYVALSVLTFVLFLYGYVNYPYARTPGERFRTHWASVIAAGLFAVCAIGAPFPGAAVPAIILIPIGLAIVVWGHLLLRRLERL